MKVAAAGAGRESRPRVEFPMRKVRRARTILRWSGRLAPSLASRLSLEFFLTLRQHPRPGREETWLESARRFEVEGTHRLAAASWGEGRKVLLAHGWEGRGSQMGALATGLADAGFEAVVFDAPGHGESAGPASLREFAIGVREMVEIHGPFAGFVAHSFGVAGGCFSITHENVQVESLGRLVFISPPDDLHHFIEFFERMLELSPRVARGFERRLARLLRASWDEARYCTQAAASGAPLLVVADEQDLETPIEGAMKVAAAWPQSEVMQTDGLGHRRILRDPEVVAWVVAFLLAE